MPPKAPRTTEDCLRACCKPGAVVVVVGGRPVDPEFALDMRGRAGRVSSTKSMSCILERFTLTERALRLNVNNSERL
jgi:hypothetical protein